MNIDDIAGKLQASTVALDAVETDGTDGDTSVVVILPRVLEQWIRAMTAEGSADQDNIHQNLKHGEVLLQAALDDATYSFVLHDGDSDETAAKVEQVVTAGSDDSDEAVKDDIWQLLNELKRKLYS